MDEWSTGPEVHWYEPFKTVASVFASIGLMAGMVAMWNPSENMWFVRIFFCIAYYFYFDYYFQHCFFSFSYFYFNAMEIS
jgi:hypothetical protein